MMRNIHRTVSVEKLSSFEIDSSTSSVLDLVCHVLVSLFRLCCEHNQVHILFSDYYFITAC